MDQNTHTIKEKKIIRPSKENIRNPKSDCIFNLGNENFLNSVAKTIIGWSLFGIRKSGYATVTLFLVF